MPWMYARNLSVEMQNVQVRDVIVVLVYPSVELLVVEVIVVNNCAVVGLFNPAAVELGKSMQKFLNLSRSTAVNFYSFRSFLAG